MIKATLSDGRIIVLPDGATLADIAAAVGSPPGGMTFDPRPGATETFGMPTLGPAAAAGPPPGGMTFDPRPGALKPSARQPSGLQLRRPPPGGTTFDPRPGATETFGMPPSGRRLAWPRCRRALRAPGTRRCLVRRLSDSGPSWGGTDAETIDTPHFSSNSAPAGRRLESYAAHRFGSRTDAGRFAIGRRGASVLRTLA